ncbi:TetR family transcriptional regulator [Paracoccus limosus]|uniref:TetR family transcriptional regulator n=1 Tax=Paracoccus limosus TaxID=913252 RepID=A0A844H3I0_9RHOB|nr:TetR/AcrR family transcriptional regulator [Paracoccus limosus]MTH34114.1 TetR family transcriptional regulator [Paracoccus limosus]
MTAADAQPEASSDCSTDCAEADTPKRRQILDGARRMFLSNGFEGTSMQDVARSAGVSKGTLYVYFDSKEAMFGALVRQECGLLQDSVRRLASGSGAVGDELLAVARQILTRLLQPEVLAVMRMTIGAGEKFPELARQIYDAGPMRTRRILADYLRRRVEAGDLLIGDCEAAAGEFMDLVVSGLQRRALLMMPPLSESEITEHTRARVGRFLAGRCPGAAQG